MTAAIRAELRKWSTTRLWWVLLLVMLAYMTFLAAVLAFATTAPPQPGGTPPLHGIDAALSIYVTGNGLGYVFPLLAGTLAMTTEFRYQTITPSLLAEPRRSVFLAAKLVVALVVGLAFGVVGTLSGLLGGAPILAWRGDGAFLGSAQVWVSCLLCVLALAIWSFLGVGVGTLLTNQVAAVVVVLAWAQFVEPILRLGLNAVDALRGASRFLPGAAADALVGASTYASLGGAELLPRWAGAIVFVGYGVLLAVLGRFTSLRRDIT